jgi:opacity protein-like surface antigen
MKKLLFLTLIFCSTIVFSQEEIEYTYNTFNSTRVINSHSTEMLEKKTMDFRIGHRFGDIAGTNGGASTLFGIDNSADISIGLEYGITNNLNVGITRMKGAGPYRQLYEGYAKYKILAQSNKIPVNLVGVVKYNVTSMNASMDTTSATSFPDFISRTSGSYQLIVSRKFSERLSMQFVPTYVHRNYVAHNGQNGSFALGAGARFQITKLIGVIGEYHYVFFKEGVQKNLGLSHPIALGVEFDTGGHIFQLNFTNSKGFGESQYIPSTSSSVADGEFRFGFTIARVFKL